jgi:MFS family permease
LNRRVAAVEADRPRLLSPAFLLVALSAFGAFLAIGVLLPTLPRYAEGPLAADGVGIGLAVGASSITALVFQPLAGRVGDRRGRRVLLLGGTGLMAATIATYVLIDALPLLVAMRLLTGIGEAFFFVGAATVVNDLAPEERRGEAFSYFTLAAYGGLALGPLIGDLALGNGRFDAVWLVAAAGALVAFLIGLTVRETRPADGAPHSGGLVYRGALLPGLVLLAGLFSFGAFNAFIALHALEVDLERTGLVFATFSVIVLGIRSVGARIPDRLGAKRTAQLALVFLTLGMMIIAAWPSVAGLFAGTVVFSVGQALAFPAVMSLAVASAPPGDRSSAVGTISAFVDVALAVGAITSGVVVGVAGYRGAFGVAALVAASGLLLLSRLRG